MSIGGDGGHLQGMEPLQPAPRHDRPGVAVLVGVICTAIDVARDRLGDWAARAEEGRVPPGLVELPPAQLRARALLIGLAVTVPPRARATVARLRWGVGGALRVAGVLARPLLRLGPVRAAADVGLALRARTAAGVAAIAATGERETARCERIAALAAREVAEEVLARVGRAAEVREVLVEQSAGLASEALGEVRRQADQADALVEAVARSLLPWRRGRRDARRARDGGPRAGETLPGDGADER